MFTRLWKNFSQAVFENGKFVGLVALKK